MTSSSDNDLPSGGDAPKQEEALKAREKMAPPSAVSLDQLPKPITPETEQGPQKRAQQALERLRRIKVEETNDQKQVAPKSEPTTEQSASPKAKEAVSPKKTVAKSAIEPEAEKTKAKQPDAPESYPDAIGKDDAVTTHQQKPEPKEAKATQSPLPDKGLVVQSVGKQFKKRPVLRDISLHVQRGEAVGLLGPNGAGKTTSFYIVTGLIAADYGQISLDGTDITNLPMYRRSRLGIGYLPQEASIFRGLNVEQNIMSVLELVEKDRNRRHEMLDNLLAEFSITHLRKSPSVALSGGERRRMEIARALASQPHFILLDEPLAGIDPIAVRDIRELVSHLKDRGIGVLITDHNVRETLDLVDRAYILHDGKVLMEGTPDEIVADEDVKRVYLGDRFQL